jgi:plasmid stabilization system protein ParE
MIRHIVLFTLREGVAAADERVRNAFAELEGLHDKIGLIREWEVGRNFSGRPIAVDYALNSTFDSREDLDAYIGHEAHQAVVVLLKEVCTWVLCDYVI